MHGSVAPGFEAVRNVFRQNLKQRDDLGAAFAVTLDGRLVVDLWGGVTSESGRQPWRSDTLTVIFSGTKPLVALCLLLLVDRGKLDITAPVARYWPEFGRHGKEDVTVLDAMSHQSRVPGIVTRLTLEDVTHPEKMAMLLADQPLETDPRARSAYHPLTFGWLCGEIVRRIDGRSVGRFFAEEVAGPLGLEVWIGLPREFEHRVSTLRYAPSWGQHLSWDEDGLRADALLNRVWNNPPLFPPGIGNAIPWNRPHWHQAEIPGAGGIATARSLARLYGCLALGGRLDGRTLLSSETLTLGIREVARRHDPLLDEPQVFAAGFALQSSLGEFGPQSDAFGLGGAGGSIHCAWPSRSAGLSYVMNTMRDDGLIDERAAALLEVTDAAIARIV